MQSFEFTADQTREMGIFVATLVREQVTYTVKTLSDGGWRITLTGGF